MKRIIEEFSRIGLFIAERTQWNVYFWHDCKLLSDAIFIFCILHYLHYVHCSLSVQRSVSHILSHFGTTNLYHFWYNFIVGFAFVNFIGHSIRADFELSNCESKSKKKNLLNFTERRRSAQNTVFWTSYKTSSHYSLCLCDRIITWIMANIKK